MRSTVQFVVALAAMLGLAAASTAQVTCSLTVEEAALPLKSGEKLAARLTVTIAPGWHISSLTQPDGGPVRTDLTLSDGQPFKLAGDILAPKPHKEHSTAFGIDVETYTGTLTFTLPLVATADIKPGTGSTGSPQATLTVEITYQACNEETCLLPKTERVTAVIGGQKAEAAGPNKTRGSKK